MFLVLDIVWYTETSIPNVKYQTEIDPYDNKSDPEPTTLLNLHIPSQKNGLFCAQVSHWNMDIDSLFQEFVKPYQDSNAEFHPLLAREQHRYFDHVYELNSLLCFYIVPFLQNLSKKNNDGLQIFYRTPGLQSVLSFGWHDRSSIFETRLEKKMSIDFLNNDEVNFFNHCKHHQGRGLCSHYFCNTIYEVAFLSLSKFYITFVFQNYFMFVDLCFFFPRCIVAWFIHRVNTEF